MIDLGQHHREGANPIRKARVVLTGLLIAGSCVQAQPPASPPQQTRPRSTPAVAKRRAATAAAALACPAATGKTLTGKISGQNFSLDPPGTYVGADFSNTTIISSVFDNVDLTGASFYQAKIVLDPTFPTATTFVTSTLTNTCFIGATLNGADFSNANVTCSDFSTASLTGANFGPPGNQLQAGTGCRTLFVGATLDINLLDPSSWGNADFTNAIFQNLNNTNFSLNGVDITNAILAWTNPTPQTASFSGIDMTAANLSGVDFTGASLLGVQMDSAQMNGIILDGANLTNATLTCAQLYGGSVTTACSGNSVQPPASANPPTAASLIGTTLPGVDLKGATLANAVLSGANLTGINCQYCSLQGANLEAQATPGSISATVTNGDFTKADFSNAQLNNVNLKYIFLTGATFGASLSKTTLAGTDFTGSTMPGAVFTNAELQDVTFDSTTLQNSSFNTTDMKSGPLNKGVSFLCSQLGGSTFNTVTMDSSTSFDSAVMPPGPSGTQPQCCSSGGTFNCGTVAVNGVPYALVTLPALTTPISFCPDGSTKTLCTGSNWMIPNWQVAACGTTIAWAAPDCGGGTGKIVKFNDANLKQCILNALHAEGGTQTEVTVATASIIPEVTCPGQQITDLTGLENFTAMTTLDVTGNQIPTFSWCSGSFCPLPALQTLRIGSNLLTALDLTGSQQVTYLDASNNKLSTPIAGSGNLDQLMFLDLSGNQLPYFNLAVMNTVVWADLSDNRLTSVTNSINTDLTHLKSLFSLNLANNLLTTIGPVNAIESGNFSLYLSCNSSFQCNDLNLPNKSSNPPTALQTSSCFQENPNGVWVISPTDNPICPGNNNALAGSKALKHRTKIAPLYLPKKP